MSKTNEKSFLKWLLEEYKLDFHTEYAKYQSFLDTTTGIKELDIMLDFVEYEYGIDRSNLIKYTRKELPKTIRQIIQYILFVDLGISASFIAKIMVGGGCDRSNIYNSKDRVADMLEFKDRYYTDIYNNLKGALEKK